MQLFNNRIILNLSSTSTSRVEYHMLIDLGYNSYKVLKHQLPPILDSILTLWLFLIPPKRRSCLLSSITTHPGRYLHINGSYV